MPPHPRHRITQTSVASYRSAACRIGTHITCTEAAASSTPVETGLPVIYETCDCPCHSAPDHSKRWEVKR
ncbi:hypothetical protein LK07_17460 [Streptomyces pluripotens]|uniref:Uncharacterized protein n=1 Tax=Streptomyces pluripotens TaxID=1355015 RepID=A0A221NZU5_9ACTN|nr:hypothetical protein LK06_016305 [Streptomyces pluripotens]ASN25527.1 hypothetical protein LK07_17460 [Streptomyces pluripotens]